MLALAAAPLVACDDASGPEAGEARVYMAQSASSNLMPGTAASMVSAMLGPISISAVDSINVQLLSIDALSSSDSVGGATLSLSGEGARSINLLELPSLAMDSVLLASAELPAGLYSNIRLRFESATITLNDTVTVGNAEYLPGTYELTIPSGLSSGIKVQGASFTVAEDDETSITLAFDPAATVGTLIATGANKLMMSPVLHARTHIDD
jgi:hypothetical protein